MYFSWRQPIELGHQTRYRHAIAQAAWNQQQWIVVQAELLAMVQTYRFFETAAYRREKLRVAQKLAEFNEQLVKTLRRRLEANQVQAADSVWARPAAIDAWGDFTRAYAVLGIRFWADAGGSRFWGSFCGLTRAVCGSGDPFPTQPWHDDKEEHKGKSGGQITMMKKLVDAGICCHETEDADPQQRSFTLHNPMASL